MHDKTVISIVMPTYNVSRYMDKSIEAILNQTLVDWELIVVDDCSADCSADIAKKYAEKDERIKIIKHEKNRGVSLARNSGIESAKGKYICFIDPDDWCDSTYLSSMYETMETVKCDLVISGYKKEKNGREIEWLSPMRGTVMNSRETVVKMLEKAYFDWSPCDKLFRREKITANKIFFNDNYKLAEDLDFCWRYLKVCQKVAFIPAYQYRYIVHDNSATHKKRTTIRMTSVEVMKNCYADADCWGRNVKARMRELYVKELASCIKDIISNRDFRMDVINMQKEIRNNIVCLWENKDFAKYIKLAILFFCLPYDLCYTMYSFVELMRLDEKMKKV